MTSTCKAIAFTASVANSGSDWLLSREMNHSQTDHIGPTLCLGGNFVSFSWYHSSTATSMGRSGLESDDQLMASRNIRKKNETEKRCSIHSFQFIPPARK